MRKLFFWAAVAAATLPLGGLATSAKAGALKVVNRTNAPILHFYARNNDLDELWQAHFEDDPIYPGESRLFMFHTRGLCDDWNIEVDTPGNEMTKTWHQSVCGGGMQWVVHEEFRGNAS